MASGAAGAWPGDAAVVALKPDKNPDAMLAEREKLSLVLQEKLGVPVQVIVPLSAAVIREGLRNGSIDAAYVSATEFLPMGDEGAAEIVLANEIAGATGYKSLWLVRREAKFSSIEELRGHPVAFSSRTSTSGFFIPLKDLHDRGLVRSAADLEEFFGRGNVLFGTGYVSAVERVLSGQAEAAAVSDYVFEGDRHLSAEQKAELRVLQSQGPVPTHVLVVSSRLGPAEKELLRSAFLDMDDSPEMREFRDRIFTAKFVPVDAQAHVAPVRAALQLALDPP
jgi:phosphonate transport system substrate-binding protein